MEGTHGLSLFTFVMGVLNMWYEKGKSSHQAVPSLPLPALCLELFISWKDRLVLCWTDATRVSIFKVFHVSQLWKVTRVNWWTKSFLLFNEPTTRRFLFLKWGFVFWPSVILQVCCRPCLIPFPTWIMKCSNSHRRYMEKWIVGENEMAESRFLFPEWSARRNKIQ